MIPWAHILNDIHGQGMTWDGIARRVGLDTSTIKKYSQAECTRMSYDVGAHILRLYRQLCPQKYDALPLAPDDAVRRIAGVD